MLLMILQATYQDAVHGSIDKTLQEVHELAIVNALVDASFAAFTAALLLGIVSISRFFIARKRRALG